MLLLFLVPAFFFRFFVMASLSDNQSTNNTETSLEGGSSGGGAEDNEVALADAKAQSIFEADPTFGIDWSHCCDSGAKDLTFVEEQASESGRVRKYQYTYESFEGPDNDMGYPQYTTVKRYIFLQLLEGWKQCSGWGDASAPAALNPDNHQWFTSRGIAPFVGQTPGR